MPRNASIIVCIVENWNASIIHDVILDFICCEGLTDGVAFVVKRKKSKIKWIIMNAFQVSTMHTIIDAFPGIQSKVAIECAQ